MTLTGHTAPPMPLEFEPASAADTAEFVRLRGLTRENAVSEQRLDSMGITAQTWADDIRSETLQGFVCRSGSDLAGYCFGNPHSGEVIVLAVRPAFENRGIGQHLLNLVIELLHSRGHPRLFLGCSSDPAVRSYGFYRYLGWRSTGAVDDHGDEILELMPR